MEGVLFKTGDDVEPLQPYPLPPCQAFIDDTRGLLNEFVEALEGRVTLLTTGKDHLKTLGLTVACIESSQTGQRVHLSDFYRRQGVPARWVMRMMENPVMPNKDTKFVGIQISPISFIDEGVEPLLDLLQDRFGINVLLIGTISWLGLKVGRRISWKLEGWPDHGRQEPYPLKGGSYIRSHPEYYRNTFIRDFGNTDPELAGKDILEMVIPEARRRGMQVYPEVMEPLFKYAGHGSANNVSIPNLPQVLEVDVFNRFGQEPCINNPDYRTWWHSIIEDYCRSYDIDGVMWCNERRSPLDNLLSGQAPELLLPALPPRGARARHRRRTGQGRLPGALRLLPGRPRGPSSSSTAP